MGEVARRLREQGLLFIKLTDFLPSYEGNVPTFCIDPAIYASDRAEMQPHTRASNCADTPPKVSYCRLTQNVIEFDWGAVPAQGDYGTLTHAIHVSCDQPTSLRVYVSGGSIPLNGDIKTRVEFDFGRGWGQKALIYSAEGSDISMTARSVLGGERESIGGCSILIMEIV